MRRQDDVSCSHAFDSDHRVFQVKWDGVRQSLETILSAK